MHCRALIAGALVAAVPALAVPQAYSPYYPAGNSTVAGPTGGSSGTAPMSTHLTTTTRTSTTTVTSFVTLASSGGPGSSQVVASPTTSADDCDVPETVTVTNQDRITVTVTAGSSTKLSSVAPEILTSSIVRHGHSYFHSKSSKMPYGFPNSSYPHPTGTGYTSYSLSTSLTSVSSSSSSSVFSPISTSYSMFTSLSSSSTSTTSSSKTSSSSFTAAPTTTSSSKTSSSSSSFTEAPTTTSSSTMTEPTHGYSTPTTTEKTTPTTTEQPTPTGSSGHGKRGVVYNDASLAAAFEDSPQMKWGYDWAQTRGDLSEKFEYVPMLWGDREDFTSTWTENIQSAIASGCGSVLAFNEPDHPGQANMSPEVAVDTFKTYFGDLAGKVRIGSPAVTNGAAPMGLDWLDSFMSACADCQIDFVAVHWYDSAANAQYFKDHVQEAHERTGKPVWVTEFAATGSDEEISAFMEDTMGWMDSQDFVERYSYFMVSDGLLVSGSSLSSIGSTYADYAS